MTRVYALHPYVWDSSFGCHRPPDGSGSALDFRPEAEQAKASQSGGYGMFHWDEPAKVPSEAIPIGSGDCREYQPTVSERNEMRLKLGLSANPAGTYLTDCISDILGPLSDPTGQNGPKPIMPCGGLLDIHLSGHSKVYSQPFDFQEVFKPSPNSRASRIRDVIRASVSEARKSGGSELAGKVVGSWLKQHAKFIDSDLVNPAKKVEWSRLLSTQDLLLLGVGFKPKNPATSFTDNFDRSDSSSLGGSWTTFLTNAEYGISGNKCIFGKASTTGDGAYQSARYDFDVSSVDHWTEIQLSSYIITSSNSWLGPVARFSSSANTGYAYCLMARSTSATNHLYKIVSGVATSLGSNLEVNISTSTPRTKCSGSTIQGIIGAVRISVTDTSITGGTRGGLTYRSTNNSYRPLGDSFLVDDGIVIPIGKCLTLLGVG